MGALKQYLPLCWLRGTPFDLPRSTAFFKANLLFYFIVEYFMQTNMVDNPVEAFFEISIETLLTLIFIALILALNKSMFAYIQVASALLFCENAASIFGAPVFAWLTVTEDLLSYYAFGIIVFWEFLLIANVLKQTLAINTPASLVMSLIYFIITYLGAYGLGQLI
jgi:hypothetical protein